jgi:hypothetical protein
LATTLASDIAFTQLPMRTKKAILGQCLCLTFALALPSITHSLGYHYLYALPMHWMVLFAGLTYGPISGMILGMAIITASFLLVGMPLSMDLPLMIPEMAVYGLFTGLLKKKVTAFGSLAVGMIAGRIVYTILFSLTGRLAAYRSVFQFVDMIWGPGLATAILQIVFLPLLSGLYINWIKD